MNNRIAQAYGYAVCFITVIVMLIAIKSVVDSAFDLSDPIHAENGGFGRMTPSLSSFELYKIQSRRAPVINTGGGIAVVARGATPDPAITTPSKATTDTLSDAELRRRYDAEREGVIGNTRHSNSLARRQLPSYRARRGALRRSLAVAQEAHRPATCFAERRARDRADRHSLKGPR